MTASRGRIPGYHPRNIEQGDLFVRPQQQCQDGRRSVEEHRSPRPVLADNGDQGSGDKTPALLSVWASNDVVQFGTVKILSGGATPQQTEYDEHPGEAVFYVLQGPMTFFCPDTAQTFDVQEGDFMFLPEHTRYKIINYYGHTAKAVFMVAPQF